MSLKALAQTLALSLALFVCCASSIAQSPATTTAQPTITAEKRAAIAELLEVTEAKKTAMAVFNSIVDTQEKETPELIWQTMSSSREVQELTPADQEALKKKLMDDSARRDKRIRELFSQKIDLATLIDEISFNLYDKYYTESEIRDLVAFYKSPTGKKSVAVMPNLFAESMSRTIAVLKPKVSEIVTELMNEEVSRARKELESMKTRKTNPPRRAKPR